jgi:hypothetical protein
MITKHTTTAGSWQRMAIGVGLVGVSALLIVAAWLANRADAPMASSSVGLPDGVRTFVVELVDSIGLGRITPAARMQSVPLGIDLPYGADMRELPTGLTDYLRPGSGVAVIHMQSVPLGIDLPYGADMRELPTGLTDYLRPQPAEQPVGAPSAVLGISMPTGAQYNDLPHGVTDYLRPNQ